MLNKCNTRFFIRSEEETRLRELYEYFEKCAKGECYLHYYKPDAANDNLEYCTEAYLDCGPEWEEGLMFSIDVISKDEPPLNFFYELCNIFFKDTKYGLDLIYVSENPDAGEYITNECFYIDTYVINFSPSEDDPEELKAVEKVIDKYGRLYVKKEVLIEQLSPFYPEAETDLDSVLRRIEEKYEEYGIEFIKVEVRDE